LLLKQNHFMIFLEKLNILSVVFGTKNNLHKTIKSNKLWNFNINYNKTQKNDLGVIAN
jgi:hypothetical protein